MVPTVATVPNKGDLLTDLERRAESLGLNFEPGRYDPDALADAVCIAGLADSDSRAEVVAALDNGEYWRAVSIVAPDSLNF